MRQARTRFSPERVLFLAAALVLVLGTQVPVTSYISPKSGLGYSLGAIGGLMLLSQALYAFRKRLLTVRLLMMLGIIAPVLILIHCGFSLGATNSTIALAAMSLVTLSGLCGRYFYSKTHRAAHGRKATLAELEQHAREAKERGANLLRLPELAERFDNEERELLQVGEWSGPAVLAAPFAIARRYASSRHLLSEYARGAIKAGAARHKAVAAQQERCEKVTFEYITRRLYATRTVVEFRVYERLFSIWRVVHVPLLLVLLAATTVHVISVHVY
jgi:hypothetical protein